MTRVAALAAMTLALGGCAQTTDQRISEYVQCTGAGMTAKISKGRLVCEPSPVAHMAGPGLTIRVDPLTGCQYLESRTGFLVPRLDSDNFPVCNEDTVGTIGHTRP